MNIMPARCQVQEKEKKEAADLAMDKREAWLKELTCVAPVVDVFLDASSDLQLPVGCP